MFTLPKMASLTELSMCGLVFSCFLSFSDRCFISLTPVTVHAGSAPVAINSKHGKQNKVLAETHPHSQAFLVY